MKKLLFIILSLTILSCSSNDSDNNENNITILPKAVITIDSGAKSDTALFYYDNNKIKSIIYKKHKIAYQYDGNVISKKTYYEIVGGKEVKVNEEDYFYANGKLKSIKYFDDMSKSPKEINLRNAYTYLADTLVKEQRFSTNYLTNIEREEDYYSLYTIKNGNRIKSVTVNTKTGKSSNALIYVYDNKNSPFKNILGVDLLINDEEYSLNNILSISSADSGFNYEVKKYEYDTDGYPNLKTNYKGGKEAATITKYLY